MSEPQVNAKSPDRSPLVDQKPEEKRGITKQESTMILAASVLAAASAFLGTVIAKHFLSAHDNSEFLIFWATIFAVFGIVAGIQQEVTRAVGARRLQHKGESGADSPGAPVVGVALIFGAVIGGLVLATSPLWAENNLPTQTTAVVVLLSISVLFYAVHSAMSGAAAGQDKWYLFSALGGGEALWRLAALVLIGFSLATLWGFEVAVASTVLLWVFIVLFTKTGKKAFGARADVGAWPLSQRILMAMGSSAASAVLMMGFPLAMKSSLGSDSTGDQQLLLGMLILAISVCRSPIMIPLQAFQGVAISAFLKQRHRPLAAMAKPSAALLGVGAFGAILAFFIGPWLFRIIYKPKPEEVAVYDQYLSGGLLAGLVFGSAVLALLVLSGTAVIALDAHRMYVAGWVVAAVVAVALLWLPIDLIPRTLIGLYVGPACGFAVHLWGIQSAVKSSDSKNV